MSTQAFGTSDSCEVSLWRLDLTVFRLVRDKSANLDEMQELPHQLAALLEREVAAFRLHSCLHRFTEHALLL